MGRARRLLLDPRGGVVAERGLSKLRHGERGAAYVYQQLITAGCPPRRVGEEACAYVSRVLASGALRTLPHPGNHVYAWPLARGVQLQPGQTYPKAVPT